MTPQIGQWLYFAKKKKKGQMIGNVLGRGFYLGQNDGCHIFQEGQYGRKFSPKVDEVVVYSLN